MRKYYSNEIGRDIFTVMLTSENPRVDVKDFLCSKYKTSTEFPNLYNIYMVKNDIIFKFIIKSNWFKFLLLNKRLEKLVSTNTVYDRQYNNFTTAMENEWHTIIMLIARAYNWRSLGSNCHLTDNVLHIANYAITFSRLANKFTFAIKDVRKYSKSKQGYQRSLNNAVYMNHMCNDIHNALLHIPQFNNLVHNISNNAVSFVLNIDQRPNTQNNLIDINKKLEELEKELVNLDERSSIVRLNIETLKAALVIVND